MTIIQLNRTIDTWINALSDYNLETLQEKIQKDSWSLGQVYNHILDDTNYYIEQIELCLTHNENQLGEMTEFAITLFLKGEFPDIKIKGDSSASKAIPQPSSKANLINQMIKLKIRLNSIWIEVINGETVGKTKHPGLGYFSAQDWLKFSEIHMRHHLRQKGRIDDALKRINL